MSMSMLVTNRGSCSLLSAMSFSLAHSRFWLIVCLFGCLFVALSPAVLILTYQHQVANSGRQNACSKKSSLRDGTGLCLGTACFIVAGFFFISGLEQQLNITPNHYFLWTFKLSAALTDRCWFLLLSDQILSILIVRVAPLSLLLLVSVS